jgi:hypothetical protein
MEWLKKQIAQRICFFLSRFERVFENKKLKYFLFAACGRSMGRNKAAANALFSIPSKLKARNCSWIS